MKDEDRIRVRASRSSGELEIEGPVSLVTEWWGKLWPDLQTASVPTALPAASRTPANASSAPTSGEVPEIFGEFLHSFRSDISDVDRMLIAAAFVQMRDSDRVFTTKSANQLLIDQNIKLANPSESVRRLGSAKRSFVVSDGKFRVSATGFDHLKSLKSPNE